jgi:hypothetical protein
VRSFIARKTANQRVAGFGYGLAVVLLFVVAGCVTSPPVQEMSDARQAIAVAKDAGAAELASAEFSEAEAYLASAQKKLSERSYNPARRDALLAKDKALEALALAESAANDDST